MSVIKSYVSQSKLLLINIILLSQTEPPTSEESEKAGEKPTDGVLIFSRKKNVVEYMWY